MVGFYIAIPLVNENRIHVGSTLAPRLAAVSVKPGSRTLAPPPPPSGELKEMGGEARERRKR